MPIVPGLRVVRSPIHGYGVVAQRPFGKGEEVVRAEGFIYAEDESFDDTYALVLPASDLPGAKGDHVYYDLVDQTRWINHSCEPNTEVESKFDEASGRPIAGALGFTETVRRQARALTPLLKAESHHPMRRVAAKVRRS